MVTVDQNQYKSQQLLNIFRFNGAPEGNNLEPFECDQILTELEEWTSILQAEPEVIHRLAAFAEAAENASDKGEDDPKLSTALEEPAP